MRPKIAPNQAQNQSELRFCFKGPCRTLLWPLWRRFGTALGGHDGAKIGLGSDLKSLRKEKSNLIPFRSGFWIQFERFLTPHMRSKRRSKQQENDYCRSFKIIDFHKEKTRFLLLREMSYSLKNKLVSLSWSVLMEWCYKVPKKYPVGISFGIDLGPHKASKSVWKGFRLPLCF